MDDDPKCREIAKRGIDLARCVLHDDGTLADIDTIEADRENRRFKRDVGGIADIEIRQPNTASTKSAASFGSMRFTLGSFTLRTRLRVWIEREGRIDGRAGLRFCLEHNGAGG